MSHVIRKQTMWFRNRSDTNRALQVLKMAKGWKFCIYPAKKMMFSHMQNVGFLMMQLK